MARAAPISDAPGSQHSLTLGRGLRVLRVLGEHPDGLSVSELAAALQTHRAGIYRLLGPLVDERLVERDADGRHHLGPGLLELASRVRPRLQEVAQPQLRQLADRLGATAALTVRYGDEAVVVAVVEPTLGDMRIVYRAGLRHPLDVAASGVAILAGGPARPGERAEVTRARRRGYARTVGELLPGVTGIAAPVRGGPGEAVASAVSAVWVDPRPDEREAAGAVIATADAIAAALR
jgi:DNA-binding IclR family transcriptional regulator